MSWNLPGPPHRSDVVLAILPPSRGSVVGQRWRTQCNCSRGHKPGVDLCFSSRQERRVEDGPGRGGAQIAKRWSARCRAGSHQHRYRPIQKLDRTCWKSVSLNFFCNRLKLNHSRPVFLNRWTVKLFLVGRQAFLNLFKIGIAYAGFIKFTKSQHKPLQKCPETSK